MRKKMHQTGKFFSFILLGLGCLCLISGGILIGRQMSATPKAESSAPEEVPYEQEKITDAEVTGEFYYEQLSDEEQTVYREILQGIQENKKEIYLHCSNANTANEVFQNVLNDRPEIFWCDGNATSTEYSQSEGQSRYVVIEPNYLYEGEEKEQRNQEIESARTSCLSGISDLSDEYEKTHSREGRPAGESMHSKGWPRLFRRFWDRRRSRRSSRSGRSQGSAARRSTRQLPDAGEFRYPSGP